MRNLLYMWSLYNTHINLIVFGLNFPVLNASVGE